MELSQFGHGLAVGGFFTVATWAAWAHQPVMAGAALMAGSFLCILAALSRPRR